MSQFVSSSVDVSSFALQLSHLISLTSRQVHNFSVFPLFPDANFRHLFGFLFRICSSESKLSFTSARIFLYHIFETYFFPYFLIFLIFFPIFFPKKNDSTCPKYRTSGPGFFRQRTCVSPLLSSPISILFLVNLLHRTTSRLIFSPRSDTPRDQAKWRESGAEK